MNNVKIQCFVLFLLFYDNSLTIKHTKEYKIWCKQPHPVKEKPTATNMPKNKNIIEKVLKSSVEF